MALHDFHCRACGRDFESIIHPWEKDGIECKHCGARKLDGQPAVVKYPVSLTGPHRWAGNSDGAGPLRPGRK